MRLFDLHCDTLYRAYMEKSTLFNDSFHISFNKTGEISPYVQCLAVWIPDEYRGEAAERLFEGCRSKLHEQLDGTEIIRCVCPDDLERVTREGKTGVILTVESGAALGGKIGNVSRLYDAGVRMMTLTWNGTNELGDGIGAESSLGLSEFGKKAVVEMEKQGIIIDLSHASERLFYDTMEITSSPVVASHSNAKALCPHRRNLSDEQFSIIKQRGGIVGINFCRDFLNKTATNARMYDIIRVAEHFLSIGGEDVVAMGGDFDGADIPSDMSGIENMAELYELFLRHYTESVTDKIFYGNAYSFFMKVL